MVYRKRAARGTLLMEALVALSILGIVLVFGAGFFARRRELERDRLDREKALRALASEWVFVRTALRSELEPRVDGLFVGPGDFVDGLDPRNPKLTIKSTSYPDLFQVRLEIDCGVRPKRRIVQEGYVYRGASP